MFIFKTNKFTKWKINLKKSEEDDEPPRRKKKRKTTSGELEEFIRLGYWILSVTGVELRQICYFQNFDCGNLDLNDGNLRGGEPSKCLIQQT